MYLIYEFGQCCSLVDVDTLVYIFKWFLRNAESKMMMWLNGITRKQVKIKRALLYKDSMENLNLLGAKLKHKSKC